MAGCYPSSSRSQNGSQQKLTKAWQHSPKCKTYVYSHPHHLFRASNLKSTLLTRKQTSKIKIAQIKSSPDIHAQKSTPTIFHDILSSNLPEAEKSLDRLYQEGQTFIAAGTETTAWCLTVITFYLLSDPAILNTLRNELRGEGASTSVQLERLPYLSAVIQEGLRLSFGVCARLPRIATGETLVLRDGERAWSIPPNVCSH